MGNWWERAKTVGGLVRAITVVVVAIVAVIAAVVSYSHMADVAHKAGEAWRSYLIPISIDGLIVAAALTCLTRQRAGLKNSYLAWAAFGSGALISVLANIADARREPWAIFLASSAPIVLAWAFEMLLMQLRAERHVTDGVNSTSAPTETVRQNQPGPPTRTIPTPTAIAPTVSAPTTAVPAPSPVTAAPVPLVQPPRAPTPPTAGRGTTTARGHSNTEWARGVTRPTRPRPGSVLTEEEWNTMDGLTDAGISDFDVGKRMGRSEATVKKRRLERQQRRVQRNGDERMVRR